MLPHREAMYVQLGAMLAYLEGNLGPSWGYVGPSCGLCWPMLTHLKPQGSKNGNSKKHCKARDILTGGVGRGQGLRPLSPSERREGLRQCHGQLRARRAPGRI